MKNPGAPPAELPALWKAAPVVEVVFVEFPGPCGAASVVLACSAAPSSFSDSASFIYPNFKLIQ